MKKIIKKIIIWLFEKYAFNYWVNEQDRIARKEFQERYKLEDDEINEAMIDKQQEGYRDAYQQGRADGYNEAMNESH